MDDTGRDEFIDALRTWAQALMHESMDGFITYAKERGLSLSQVGALFYIQHQGPCSMSAVKEHLSVTGGAASQLLDRLVRQGYVIREEDAEDRRSKRMELTRAGADVVRETVAARQRWFGELADLMSPEERQRAGEALRTLSAKTKLRKGANE